VTKKEFKKPELYINQETSWLEFNRRVLSEGLDPRNHLLERIKFFAIFNNNLDEFFMKRVGGLKRLIGAGVNRKSSDGLTPSQQLEIVRPLVLKMLDQQQKCLEKDIFPGLRENDIDILSYSDLSVKQRKNVDGYFNRSVFPILTPLGVGPAQPFPFISNLSLSLAVLLQKPKSDTTALARLKIPQNRPRWVETGVPNQFLPIEQLISAHLDTLFPGMEILESCSFRVTRNADIERNEEEAEDLLELIEEELRDRRFAPVVRLEINRQVSEPILDWLTNAMELSSNDVYLSDTFLGLRDIMKISQLDIPHLKDQPWKPVTNSQIKELDENEAPIRMIALMNKKDLFLHHPYDSFATSVERFLKEASVDPNVLAIKQTLYRTADDSPIIGSLVRAAENGKQVAVLVEIKARFDEANNIQWVRTLERAGIHVTYGFVGLKTHTKTLLVVREEPDGVRRYFHIGTGNYHSETANLYTDLGVLSCSDKLGADLTDLFNFLTGHSQQRKYRKLLVAPVNMRRRFLQLIRREIKYQNESKKGRIIAKMNSLEDTEMIAALYEASKAGVQIDLIVRGICCLRPGLPGVSENIRVISIIGRFLEHSRIYYFHNNGKPEYYIGSADWMRRNLDFRVEACTPIEDEVSQKEIKEILDIMLSDNRNAWTLHEDKTYTQRQPAEGEEERSCHKILMKRSAHRALS